MNTLLLGAKKMATLTVAALFGASIVSADPGPGDLTFALNIAKIGAYLAFAILCWKVLRPINDFLDDLKLVRAEHRLMIGTFWEEHPDKKDDFYMAMGREQNKKAFFYNGRKA